MIEEWIVADTADGALGLNLDRKLESWYGEVLNCRTDCWALEIRQLCKRTVVRHELHTSATRDVLQKPPLSHYSTFRTRIQVAHCSATRDPAIFHCQLRSSALMWPLWALSGSKRSYHTHHVNRRVGSLHSREPTGRFTSLMWTDGSAHHNTSIT